MDFYKNLQPFKDEMDIFNEALYHQIPDDWSVIITDIKKSTQAIKDGFYKDVNTIGVASIIAAKNACTETEIPFVFGGDGAIILVPNNLVSSVSSALAVTKFTAADQFNLELRISIIPMTEIKARNGEIFIAKKYLSSSANLAMMKGNGLVIAEEITKTSNDFSHNNLNSNNSNAHQGFTCKFAPVKASNGEILVLIIEACKHNFKIYIDILTFLNQNSTHLDLEKNYDTVQYSDHSTYNETKLSHRGFKKIFLFLIKSILFHIYTFIMQIRQRPILNLVELSKNTDQLKFDNSLRTILDVTPNQRVQILEYLRNLESQSKIYFGHHLTETALMTCYIGISNKEHFHFIDGNSGGYAIAAQLLKQKSSCDLKTKIA